jgi:hypothetical protein
MLQIRVRSSRVLAESKQRSCAVMNMMESRPQMPCSELKASVAVPFEQARAMPASVYTSQEFLAQELEHIFSREWFCAGRASALSKPGDYTTLELAGQPVMVIRDHDGNAARPVECLPAPHVHAADRFRQHPVASSARITPGPTISTAHCAAHRQ